MKANGYHFTRELAALHALATNLLHYTKLDSKLQALWEVAPHLYNFFKMMIWKQQFENDEIWGTLRRWELGQMWIVLKNWKNKQVEGTILGYYCWKDGKKWSMGRGEEMNAWLLQASNNKELQMMTWKLVVQRWHFGDKIGITNKRRKEQTRVVSKRTRSLGV